MLRSTLQGRLISRRFGAGVLTQPTPKITPALPTRADLALPVGCVSRAGKCFGWHGVERGVTQHEGASSIEPISD